MKSPISLLAVSLLIAVSLAPRTLQARSACDEAVGNPPHKPGQLLVKYRSSVSAAKRGAIVGSLRATRVRQFQTPGLELIQLPDAAVDRAVRQLRSDPDVLYAEPNYVMQSTVCTPPNDDLFPDQLNLSTAYGINAVCAWDTYTTTGFTIGIFDTGIDDHPDLGRWRNPGESLAPDGIDNDANGYVDDIYGWNFVSDNGDVTDDMGHGTAVAGVASAIRNNHKGIAGVTRGGKVAALKILDAGGCGLVSDAIAALEYCTAKGIKVTNHSYGRECSDFLDFSQALLDAINA